MPSSTHSTFSCSIDKCPLKNELISEGHMWKRASIVLGMVGMGKEAKTTVLANYSSAFLVST